MVLLPLMFYVGLIWVTVFALGEVCLFIILCVYFIIAHKNRIYSINDSYICLEKGVFVKHKIYISNFSLKSIKVKQSVIQKIFHVYSMALYTNFSKNLIINISLKDLKTISNYCNKRIKYPR